MRVKTFATFVVALVVAFGGFGILAADAANPAGFAVVVNPLAHVAAGGELFGTTCTSASQCVAVGWDLGHQPLALTGDPSSWGLAQTRQVTLPVSFNKSPADGMWLLSVSCTSSTSCVAVGQDGNDQPLILAGNPSTWTAAQAREITLGTTFGFGGSFDSVTCTSSTACVAVGYDYSGNYGQPIVLAGDPATWSAAQVQRIPLGFAFGAGGSLESVACTSSTECVAVGYDYNGDFSGEPIVLAGDPATWGAPQLKEIKLDEAAGSSGSLWSVACTSSTSCLAVGNNASRQPFVLSGDPSSWGPAQAYEVTLGSAFGSRGSAVSVTCGSSSSCVAVGWDGKDQPLVLAGDPSTTWTAAQAREITLGAGFGSGGYLDSVSCASPSTCAVTGSDVTGMPLLLSGDPSTWGTAQAKKITLTGVQWGARVDPSALTCVSATSCLDLGTSRSLGFNPSNSYFMQGSPATWNQASPTPMTGLSPYTYIASNACPSATYCVAVGTDGYTGYPLVLVGNPTTWSTTHGRVIPLGNAFGFGGELDSVACSSTTSCVAVGQTYNDQPLVIRGNPATWTSANAVQITLPTTLHSRGALLSVTCTSATACVAVGYDGRFQQPLVFHGNPAKWKAASAQQITLTAALGPQGGLFSVACTSSTLCVSVGESGKATSPSKPLVLAGDPATWTVKRAFNLKVAAGTPSSVRGYGGFGGGGYLWSTSCDKVSYCVAVGGDGYSSPVYIAGNPIKWHFHPLVRPTKSAAFAVAEFDTTSCIATKCFAGGFANSGDFLGSFNGVASGGQIRRATTSAQPGVSSVRGWARVRGLARTNQGAERRETRTRKGGW